MDRRDFLKTAALPCLAVCGAARVEGAAESDAPFTTEARFYEKLAYKKIKCKLCPRECVIDDRERGYCGVRENRGGTYYTLVQYHRQGNVLIDVGVVVVHALQQEVVRLLAGAIDADRSPLRRVLRALRRRLTPRRQKTEGEEVALVQWQLVHLQAGDHLTQRRGVRLDQRRRVSDLHFLGDNTDLEREIDSCGLIHIQRDVAVHTAAKPRFLHRQHVSRRRQESKQCSRHLRWFPPGAWHWSPRRAQKQGRVGPRLRWDQSLYP